MAGLQDGVYPSTILHVYVVKNTVTSLWSPAWPPTVDLVRGDAIVSEEGWKKLPVLASSTCHVALNHLDTFVWAVRILNSLGLDFLRELTHYCLNHLVMKEREVR